ncbi:MAG TPA: hypothetical protein VGE12_00960 [Noviherbaspirillum sp.]
MRRLLTALWLVTGSCGFTYWWYNSLLAMPLSEGLWTWFNRWFDGQRPGIASDLEFIVVVGTGVLLAYAASKAITTCARRS